MTLAELQDECRFVMQSMLDYIKKNGEMRLAMAHLYTADNKREILAIEMPDPKVPHARDVIRLMIVERVMRGDVVAIVFVSETWSAKCSPEEYPKLEQWRRRHGNSLKGSPWTRDVLICLGSCAEGETNMLTCEFDKQRRPGQITENTDTKMVDSRYTSRLPWPR